MSGAGKKPGAPQGRAELDSTEDAPSGAPSGPPDARTLLEQWLERARNEYPSNLAAATRDYLGMPEPPPAGPCCEPWETGLGSSARAVARKLSELLTAMSGLDTNIARGSLPMEMWDLRIQIHKRLQAEGWRVEQSGQQGWKVSPPRASKAKRAEAAPALKVTTSNAGEGCTAMTFEWESKK